MDGGHGEDTALGAASAACPTGAVRVPRPCLPRVRFAVGSVARIHCDGVLLHSGTPHTCRDCGPTGAVCTSVQRMVAAQPRGRRPGVLGGGGCHLDHGTWIGHRGRYPGDQLQGVAAGHGHHHRATCAREVVPGRRYPLESPCGSVPIGPRFKQYAQMR